MKRKLLLVFAVLVIVALVPVIASADVSDGFFKTELTADGGSPETAVDVGDVFVSDDGEELTVQYVLSDPVTPGDPQLGEWCMIQTHLDAQSAWVDIPQTKRNSPIPGKFAYGDDVLECVGDAEYTIPMPAADNSGAIYIAAHTKVQQVVGFETDLPGFELALPEQVTIRAINYPNADSYFDTKVTNGGDLDGTYPTWCIDETHTIYTNRDYTANVYSSYEVLPESLTTGTDPHIDNPDNLDLVNYIINQDWEGMGYTSGNVQNAIWNLIDANPPSCGAPCQEIVDDALLNGEGYVPPCGGVVAVVLAPVDETAQVVIGQALTIQVGTECKAIWGEDTAWGGPYPDITFNSKDWSIYFKYFPGV